MTEQSDTGSAGDDGCETREQRRERAPKGLPNDCDGAPERARLKRWAWHKWVQFAKVHRQEVEGWGFGGVGSVQCGRYSVRLCAVKSDPLAESIGGTRAHQGKPVQLGLMSACKPSR
eukprot:1178285-Prorocentrum_minimum.AAC.6